MSTKEGLKVYTKWLPGGEFFIWSENQNTTELKYRLFAGHSSSYYGTFIDFATCDSRPGIRLSPRDALDFFTAPPCVQTFTWEWDAEIARLQKIAPLIKKALEEGHWKPDFKKWQQNKTGWKLTWPEKPDTGDVPSYLEEWVDLLINELIRETPGIREAWDKLAAAYPPLSPNHSRTDYIEDEEEWLETIGWTTDSTPFKTNLQLVEPEEENSPWRLSMLLQDKEDPGRIVEWEPLSPEPEAVPAGWQEHLGRVKRDQKKWAKIIPRLANEPEEAPGLRRELNEEEAWEFLTSGGLQLINAGYTVLLPGWWEELQKLKPTLKVNTRSSVGSWGESQLGVSQLVQFDWKVAVGGLELTEKEFQRLAKKKQRLLQFQGKWIHLDTNFIKKVQKLVKQKKKLSLGEVLQMHFLSAPYPEEEPEQANIEEDDLEIQVELNEQLARMVEQLNHGSTVTVEDTSPAFRGQLRNYQRVGSSWLLFLRRFGLGGCLADDMGLGKTIQWIAYLLKVRETEKPSTPALLICPTSVLGNWQKELARFAPDLKVYLHYGSRRKKQEDFLPALGGVDLVITSYNLAHLDEEELRSVEWDCLCLDEAQNIKNAYTKQALAVRRLKGRHRVALTGTPMENRLTELWSIMDFLNPGYLGGITEFKRRFVSVIERKREARDIERVQRLIRPFLLRRAKTDPAIELDLPEKQELKEYIPLTAEQASLYEQVLNEMFERLEETAGIARRGLILSTLTKLKQLCNHPALLLKEEKPAKLKERSNKIERLLEMVGKLREEGDRCLIFTQFVGMGSLLQRLLQKELGEDVLFLHGSISKRQRDKMITRFQEPETPQDTSNIFILSLKAGGLGLNLTAANHVFHFDRWWNPAVENQATDRSHRIGQKRHVLVHKFISLGTLEERIDEMIERKQGLNNQIVGGGEAWITELSTKELREIFTLRKEWID